MYMIFLRRWREQQVTPHVTSASYCSPNLLTGDISSVKDIPGGDVMTQIELHYGRCLCLFLLVGTVVIVYDRYQLPSDDVTLTHSFSVNTSIKELICGDSVTPPGEEEIRCETLVQQPISEPGTYIKYRQTDAIGGDLFPVRTHDILTLRRLCDALPDCTAFNTNGWLKATVQRKYPASTDLYLKVRVQPGEEVYLSSRVIEEKYGKEYTRMTKQLKVYIYKVKADRHVPTRRYQQDWGGKYDVEPFLLHLLARSHYRTMDPTKATFFLVPTRCTSYRLMVADRGAAQAYTEQLIKDVVHEIRHQYPFWNRSLGSDHFYVCAHDFGVGSVSASHPDVLKNAIGMVTTADGANPYYNPHKDISLPPHASHDPSGLSSIGRGGTWIDPDLRTTLAFFAGDLTAGPVRAALAATWQSDSEMVILGHHLPRDTYIKHLMTSQFCLCPRGHEVWSPRLIEAVWFGCVPVVLADYYHLPLQGLIDWDTFSVRLHDNQVTDLKRVLKAITIREMERKRIAMRQVYGHLTWSDPPRPYDAFHSVLFQLWQRRYGWIRVPGTS